MAEETIRPFRNGDVPAIVDLWNRAMRDNHCAYPLRVDALDRIVLSKLYFDPADLLASANLLMQWRDKARSRGVPLDKVTIVAGDQRINLQHTDTQTLARLLEGLREA